MWAAGMVTPANTRRLARPRMSSCVRGGGDPAPAARIEYHQRPPDARHCEPYQNGDDDGQAGENHSLLPSTTPGGVVRHWRLLPRVCSPGACSSRRLLLKLTQVARN